MAHAQSVGLEVDGGASGVFGTLAVADQLHLDPVVLVGIHVAQQDRRTVDGIDDDVDFAVVEQVAEGRAAGGDNVGEAGSLDGLDVFKFAVFAVDVGDVMEEQGALGEGGSPVVLVHLGIHVAVDFEEVEPAVVVVIEKAIAPADKGDGGLGNTGFIADVGEARVAIVVEEDFVVVAEVGNKEAEQALVFVVARGDAHGGDPRGRPY